MNLIYESQERPDSIEAGGIPGRAGDIGEFGIPQANNMDGNGNMKL